MQQKFFLKIYQQEERKKNSNTHEKIEKWKAWCFYWRNNKIALTSNNDSRMQSIYSTESYVSGTSKNQVSEKWD